MLVFIRVNTLLKDRNITEHRIRNEMLPRGLGGAREGAIDDNNNYYLVIADLDNI